MSSRAQEMYSQDFLSLVTDNQVRSAFAAVVSGGDDSITSVRLIRDRAKNLGKGFGYVAFKVCPPVSVWWTHDTLCIWD